LINYLDLFSLFCRAPKTDLKIANCKLTRIREEEKTQKSKPKSKMYNKLVTLPLSPYSVILSPDLSKDYSYLDQEETQVISETEPFMSSNTKLNTAIISTLLFLGLTTNLMAFPVILFRRTRFGNGQFAVLVLCLTMADWLTACCGLVGGLVLEVGHMTWSGSSTGCSTYYFLTSWLLGLANYLVAVLIGLVHVKRSTGWLSRLQECRSLLLVLTIATLIPALPELMVRSTIQLDDNLSLCYISASPVPYGMYVTLKLLVLHLVPMMVVLASILRPQTKVAKRFSTLFLGEGAACECGPAGEEMNTPHECPNIGDTPDLVISHKQKEKKEMLITMDKSKATTKLITVREDPQRRRYKRFLSMAFLACTLLYLVLDLSFQLQSVSVSQWEEVEHGANLATALLTPTYLKQIINPIILIYTEFYLH
jgi:hypothetical protein